MKLKKKFISEFENLNHEEEKIGLNKSFWGPGPLYLFLAVFIF